MSKLSSDLTFLNYKKKLDSLVQNFRKKPRASRSLSSSFPRYSSSLPPTPSVHPSSFFPPPSSSILPPLSSIPAPPSLAVYPSSNLPTYPSSNPPPTLINFQPSTVFPPPSSFQPPTTTPSSIIPPSSFQPPASSFLPGLDLTLNISGLLENEVNITEEKEEITKYKELIYKLQLRDAIHRQEIKKLMEKNETLDRKVKKLENGNREGNGMTFLRKQLDAERAKVAALEAKIERINPIQTAKLLEKLSERNEELEKENLKMEEILKQFLLEREIDKVRNIQTHASEEKNKTSFIQEDSKLGNDQSFSTFPKNISLDLKDVVKRL